MRWMMLGVFVLLAACAGRPGPTDPLLSDRKLNIEEFFDGRTVAHGQFQDAFGTVRRRFVVTIGGGWQPKTGTPTRDENFVYQDGTTENRKWTLTKTGPDTWQGTAPGVLGTATGIERGDTFNWTYRIDLPVPDGTLRVGFDDWMWLLTEDRLLNIAYMRKAGVRIGQVVITFEKG
jgi:hypothetical protein